MAGRCVYHNHRAREARAFLLDGAPMGAAVVWYRVEAPTFCAAVKVEATPRGPVVVGTAPILDWILARRDRSLAWFLAYATRRRWKVDALT